MCTIEEHHASRRIAMQKSNWWPYDKMATVKYV